MNTWIYSEFESRRGVGKLNYRLNPSPHSSRGAVAPRLLPALKEENVINTAPCSYLL